MRKLKVKLLSFLLVVVFLVAMVPFAALAEASVSVSSWEEFKEKIPNGGEFVLTDYITIFETVNITKDTVIKANGYGLNIDNSYLINELDAEVKNFFVVSGATLTIDFTDTHGNVDFSGTGSTIKLVGVEGKETKLICKGTGSFNARSVWVNAENAFCYPKSFIEIVNPDENKVSVELDGISCSVAAMNTEGPLFSGDKADIQILQGMYGSPDTSEYVAPNSIWVSNGSGIEVLKVVDEPLDEVKSFLDREGKLVLKRKVPETEGELFALFNDMYYESSDVLENYYIDIVYEKFDVKNDHAYIKVCEKESGNFVQTLKVPMVFEYDKAMIEPIQKIIDGLPKGKVVNDEYIPYCYSVSDLELVNFWLTCNEDNYYNNIDSFINYSDEFKQNLGYKNFAGKMGYGEDAPLFTFCGGDVQFYYNGVAYGCARVEVKGEHIIYVPDNTEDTIAALLKAAQERIDAYVGNDKVEAEYKGEILDVMLRDHYESTREEWESINPNCTFDEWKQSSFCPTFDVENDFGIEGITDTTPLFTTTINGIEHQFLIFKDSSKMVTPKYQNVDFRSNIKVDATNAAIPLDTLLQVEKLTSGEEYDRIINVLKPEESTTFDIKLHSASKDGYVDRLDNGSFTVKIPIPEGFEGKDLEIRYVHENGQIEEFIETIEDGYIKFPTNHFSAYTLTATTPFKETESAKTQDNTNNSLWISLSLVSGIMLLATVYNKKRFEV